MVRVVAAETDVLQVETPLLAVAIAEGELPTGALARLDEALGGGLRRLIEVGEVSGKRNSLTVLHTALAGGETSRIKATRIAIIGRGKPDATSLETARNVGAIAAKQARDLKLPSFAIMSDGLAPAGAAVRDVGQALAEGIHLGLYRYDRFKSDHNGEEPREVREATVLATTPEHISELRAGVADGERLAIATMLARDLATGPANLVTATYLGEHARAVAREYGLAVQIFGKRELEDMGCGGILAVNQGSAEPPVMGVVRYDCGHPGAKTLAVVGKGITFDTGGISIKPADNMHYMRHDKSGACAVIGFMQAAAALRLPVNVLGVFGATDNMPSGSAYRPGDVIKSYAGKYMEILNTDAEGRVVLADALAYAVEQRPDAMVDLATLTGACVVALGHVASGLFSNNDPLADALIAAGDASGERVWRLPLWDEYREQINAPLGDIKNTGGRPAGSITAAWFLANFVGDVPWAHLDIAGTAWGAGSWAVMPPYVQKDLATGVGVRLLAYFARSWAGDTVSARPDPAGARHPA